MADPVSFRWLGLNEAATGMDAIRKLWNPKHTLASNKEFFLWQYGKGRDAEHLGFLVAEDSGAIVGCIGLIIMPFHAHGRPLRGACGSISYIEPRYRRAMTGYAMMKVADADWDIMMNCGITERVARLYRAQKRHVFEAFPRQIAAGEVGAFHTYLINAGYSEAERDAIHKNAGVVYGISAPPGYRISELDATHLHEWDRIWQETFAPRLIGVERSSRYISWRYLEHPIFRYNGIMARDPQGCTCGLAIWRSVPLPGGLVAMRILDFLPADESASRVLACALYDAMPRNCAYIEHSSTGNHASGLRAIGLTQECADRISVYTTPPLKEHCRLKGSYMIQGDGFRLTSKEFAYSPDLYLTLADFDCDRPHNEEE